MATAAPLPGSLLTRAWLQRGWLAWLLWPLSVFYGGLVRLRKTMYSLGWLTTERLPVPVLVVGNVVAGGAGKTPVVMAMVQHLQARGIRVGVISRGYGRSSQACLEVLPGSAVEDVGDEPALIQRRTSAPVFVARRRAEAGRALLASYPQIQILVCDDGLQHLALQRDLEIGVFDDRGVGNGFLLPAGPLREPWPRPLDLLLHTGQQPAFAGFRASRSLASHALRADGSPVALADLVPGKPLLALAAIAQPEAFFAMLRAQGQPLAGTLALPDHHDFSQWAGNAEGAYTVLCTEKDAIKLWAKEPTALAVPLNFEPEPAFWAAFDRQLEQLLPF
ncbi:tetraacyldisaccharide 4'-kinase [Rhodoferax sp.]|jgi:tetraacyldisaccharide 4'-kinase|uniref:tetraacyldisaccharide 4'-kinase n=1 Tax=Rhodoferax sp. TaxID=50421 RepID=UPI00271A2E23|nr:tetraacyldisaccharide 4'-kinase [Rhodoferax sp.]MDO9144115.1 tetraacyldisaccharide 4'-kinase [Rhodoferax sp.]MDP1531810.1 tetraacyldisaccharide 4'-kinase [Rhodoferax sp.]MDP1944366.1 tetraacyldisaccharide 4'-kinase [Rhodoferax sp.]MDP2442453.1 tetraacyldisaccharide 4'-kinase [Rhodoferax sp.]MDP3191003.1 tetraacyldisaccharide 4'-kinase [Rhodoferax sp.]